MGANFWPLRRLGGKSWWRWNTSKWAEVGSTGLYPNFGSPKLKGVCLLLGSLGIDPDLTWEMWELNGIDVRVSWNFQSPPCLCLSSMGGDGFEGLSSWECPHARRRFRRTIYPLSSGGSNWFKMPHKCPILGPLYLQKFINRSYMAWFFFLPVAWDACEWCFQGHASPLRSTQGCLSMVQQQVVANLESEDPKLVEGISGYLSKL